MRLTLSAALVELDAAQAFPFDASTTRRKAMLNQGLEAILLSGRFNGTEVPLLMRANMMGELTLPRNFMTAKTGKVNGNVRDMASPWYSYLQHTSDASQWSTKILDRGDSYPTIAQPTGLVANGAGVLIRQSVPAKLRVESTGAPVTGAGSTVEVHGIDANGAQVWSSAQRGTLLTFAAVKAAPYFSVITEVIKPVTTQLAYLYACYDDSTEEIIGIYEPGETVPSYRRYYLPELANLTEDELSASTVDVLGQRRHVPLVADNDVLWTSNFRALKNAVLSVHWEDEGDETRSMFHLNQAIAFLNAELKLLRPPSEAGVIRVNAYGFGASGMQSMR